MNDEENVLSDSIDVLMAEYIGGISVVFGSIFLIVLVYRYVVAKDSLVVGSSLIAFVALALFILPNAQNVVLKIAGNEFSVEKQEAKEEKEVDDVKIQSLSSQIIDLEKTLSECRESAPRKFLITFEKLVFEEICDKGEGEAGEFYFTFIVNGQTVVNRRFGDAVSRKAGESFGFTGKSASVLAYADESRFNVSGFVKDYDGRSAIRRFVQYDLVGELNADRALVTGPVEVPIENGRSDCRAMLYLSVEEV